MVIRIGLLAAWLVWQLRRGFGWLRIPSAAGVLALMAVIVALAVVPIVMTAREPQPESATVAAIEAYAVTEPDGWVRLSGEVVPLPGVASLEAGNYALLLDAEQPGRAIVLHADGEILATDLATLTGHVAIAAVDAGIQSSLPRELRAAPPHIVGDRIIELDAAPYPPATVSWELVLLPLIVALALGIGLRMGYPMFRATTEVDVLAQPLAAGERLPIAVAGRLRAHDAPLHDPAEGLLLVARGAAGTALSVQLIPPEGGYVAPVPIGPGWMKGRIGSVYTLREEVPALAIEADGVNAILMFARVNERNKAAASVGTEN